MAVTLVLLFHAYPAYAGGGFVGVDIFFVISGFVISRTYLFPLIQREKTLAAFYKARIRRLLPALFVIIISTTTIAYFLFFPDDLQRFSRSLLAQPIYLQNFIFWNQGDYFEGSLTKPLLHTWSLAVEEQFYIAFAFLILIGRWHRSLLWTLLGSVFVLAILFGLLVAPVSPKTAFFLLPARIWEITLGIFAHLLVSRLRNRDRPDLMFVAPVAVAIVISSAFIFNETSPFPGIHSFLACTATALALVLFSVQRHHYPFLSARPVVYVGLISYPLYLWHWPVISLASIQFDRHLTQIEATSALLLSLLLASLTYHFVESPVRKRQIFSSDSALVIGCVGGSCLIILAASFLLVTKGAIFRFPKELRPFFLASQERTPYRCGKAYRILNPTSELCPINDVSGKRGVLILGDSHADMLDEMLAEMGQANAVPVFLTVRPCDLGKYGHNDYCSRAVLDTTILEAKRNGITDIIAISFWDRNGINSTNLEYDLLQIVRSDIRIWIMESTPWDDSYDPVRRAKHALKGGELLLEGISKNRYQEEIWKQRQIFSRFAKANSTSVNVLSPEDALCPHAECEYHTQGYPNYTDWNHLTTIGAIRLQPIFETVFDGIE